MDCRWRVDSQSALSECRRHPPVRAGMTSAYTYDHRGVWPLVEKDDYCGEHQPLFSATRTER